MHNANADTNYPTNGNTFAFKPWFYPNTNTNAYSTNTDSNSISGNNTITDSYGHRDRYDTTVAIANLVSRDNTVTNSECDRYRRPYCDPGAGRQPLHAHVRPSG